MSAAHPAFRRLWLWPLLIAAVSAFGLVCALLADGVWDLAGAASLAIPALLSLALLWIFNRRHG